MDDHLVIIDRIIRNVPPCTIHRGDILLMVKKNCWEIKQCGRESGGKKVKELGVCPAAEERHMDGVHGGINGGRCCWAICGTFCGGKPQGTFAKKFATCEQCEVYQQVRTEEYPRFYLIATLRQKLKN
jgi:hypothetical protein